jgi:MFS family permease
MKRIAVACLVGTTIEYYDFVIYATAAALVYGMFTMLGGPTATVLASLTFLGVNYTIGEHSPGFMQWGWRLPFLISAALIGIGLYLRLNIDETPVFAEETARHVVPKAPLAELLRLQRRQVALAAGSLLCRCSFFYMIGSYLATYARTDLGYSRNAILFVGVLDGLADIAVVVFSAHLVRPSGAPPHDVGWVGGVPIVVVCGVPAGGYRQAHLLRGGRGRHAGHRRDRLRTYSSVHP